MIAGTTKVCGVFGAPVAHSLSPPMQNNAFVALGLDYVYVPFHVERRHLEGAVAGVRAMGMAGVNVTIPHKVAIMEFLDEITQEAQIIGAVNTVYMDGDRLVGDNTDGRGFVRSLQEVVHTVAGAKVAIIGAGGAARALAVALGREGIGHLSILNRTPQKARELVRAFNDKLPGVGVSSSSIGDAQKVIMSADIVVNATSVGMHPHADQDPVVPAEWFHRHQLVCDIVYNPWETMFLKEARRRGATTIDGLGMLVHQGAIAFRLWTGHQAPVDIMRATLVEALSTTAG